MEVRAGRQVDTGLQCLLMLARYHRIAADAANLKHCFSSDADCFSALNLVRAARFLGLRAQYFEFRPLDLDTMPLPAIIAVHDQQYIVLARLDTDRALVHRPKNTSPEVISRKELLDESAGSAILLARRARLDSDSVKFGLRWFLPVIARYRKLFAEVLVGSLFLQVFALLTPLFFQVMIDKVLTHEATATLHVLAIGLLLVALFETVLGGLRNYLLSHTTTRVDVVLGARFFAHLLALPLAFFESRRVGETVARARELESLRGFLTGGTLTLVVDAAFTLVFVAVMLLYSPLLTLVVVATIPCLILISVVLMPLLRFRLEEKFSRAADNQGLLVETLNGVATLKSMAIEPRLQQRWEEQLAAYVGVSFQAASLGNLATHGAQLVNRCGTVLVLWLGAAMVMRGDLSVGQLIAFNMLAMRVSGPVLRLVQLWQEFQQAGLSLRRLADILDMPREQCTAASAVTMPPIQGRVQFDQVNFRYLGDRRDALSDVSFSVAPGELVGIVGRSGSGKSTLARLLQRLSIPQQGRILIDGVDLAQVDPATLRRQLGVVQQETFLFNCSVRDNIAVTDPGMPLERILAAARLAGAHDFILELPQGYDTVLGENANQLSGGQKQRLAIARALVTNPRILIFDEATSALDYESERILQHNMEAMCRGRTVMVIAHRLTAVRRANRILVLEQGRLIEQGSHAELLAVGGRYASLHRSQSRLAAA